MFYRVKGLNKNSGKTYIKISAQIQYQNQARFTALTLCHSPLITFLVRHRLTDQKQCHVHVCDMYMFVKRKKSH